MLKMFRSNLLLAYILLVGMPAIVLLGVLHSGSHSPALAPAAVPRSLPVNQPAAPLDPLKLVLQIGVALSASRLVGMRSGKSGSRA
jgi:hypothetical protein